MNTLILVSSFPSIDLLSTACYQTEHGLALNVVETVLLAQAHSKDAKSVVSSTRNHFISTIKHV